MSEHGRPGAKADLRDQLDLSTARWRRPAPEGADADGGLEVAFVQRIDGSTYVVMRPAGQPEGTTLVFTPSEWKAFVLGAKGGEFDKSW